MNYMLLNDRQTHRSPTETASVERKNKNLQVELIFLLQIMRNCRYTFLRALSLNETPSIQKKENDILPAWYCFFSTDQLCSVLTEASSVRVTSLLHCCINWSSSPRLLPPVNHRMWLDNYLKKHPSFPIGQDDSSSMAATPSQWAGLKRFTSSSNHLIIAPLHLPAHNSFSSTAPPPLNWTTSLALPRQRLCHCSSSLSIAWLTALTAWRVGEELLHRASSPSCSTVL